MLVVAFALTAGVFVAPHTRPWRLGQALLDSIVCAAFDRCPGALDDAYGERLARLVRQYAPNIAYERGSAELPVDFRRCRDVRCSNGPDRAEAVESSDLGLPVTAFTRVVDRRESGALYIQYWLYFPESFSGGIGRRLGPLAKYWPGFHRDDWEGYQVRVDGDRVSARASAHGHYKGLGGSGGWSPWTGWYRVSGGSHAGQLVQGNTGERTTSASDLSLIPIETLGDRGEHFAIAPPWRKDVYGDPESGSS